MVFNKNFVEETISNFIFNTRAYWKDSQYKDHTTCVFRCFCCGCIDNLSRSICENYEEANLANRKDCRVYTV